MKIVSDFSEIILEEGIGNKIVEKLAGNTPKPALLFYRHFQDGLDYRILNFGPSSEAYHDRAAVLASQWGLDFRQFGSMIAYTPFVNICKSSVSEFASGLDGIVYWGAAAKCIQAFDDDKGLKYLSVIEQEREKGKELNLAAKEVHDNIRAQCRDEWFRPITDVELENVFRDDVASLKSSGVILTNHSKDTEQIKSILSGIGLKAAEYFFEKPEGLRP